MKKQTYRFDFTVSNIREVDAEEIMFAVKRAVREFNYFASAGVENEVMMGGGYEPVAEEIDLVEGEGS